MAETPLISVVIPCYKQAAFLPDALNSLIGQEYANWECIIVNDGSSDDTRRVAEEWCKKDSRFSYIYQTNKGVSAARNAGLDRAQGQMIQFLDADDFLQHDKFSKSLHAIQQSAVNEVVITDFKMFLVSPSNLKPAYCILKASYFNYADILGRWDIDFTIPIHCGLFGGELLKGFRFSETLRSREDWFLWLHVFKPNPRCAFVAEPLVLYRMNPGGVTRQNIVMLQGLADATAKLYHDSQASEKDILFDKMVTLYRNDVISRESELTNYEEIASGKGPLGIVGSVIFRMLRKMNRVLSRNRSSS